VKCASKKFSIDDEICDVRMPAKLFCFFLGQGGIALIFVFLFREMEANLAFLLPFVV